MAATDIHYLSLLRRMHAKTPSGKRQDLCINRHWRLYNPAIDSQADMVIWSLIQ